MAGLRALGRKLESLLDDWRYPLRPIRQTVDPLRGNGRHGLRIVCLDVNHGDATLIIFPTGRVALVDSGKEAWAGRRVIPFLRNHQIGELTYYISTHFHEDHVGQRQRICREFLVKQVWDYRSFETGEKRELEGVQFQVLNSYADSEDENDRSLAFRLELDGFVYTHGADLYADGQERILARFPDQVPSHVYRANHHLHGSFSAEHLLAADPCVIVISAQEAVYERVAYTRDFLQAVEALRERGGRLRDICLTLERGNVVVFANSASDWGHASYAPNIILSGLYP
jgi:beta-lactamase superfamily II metal-dependent hydrolase